MGRAAESHHLMHCRCSVCRGGFGSICRTACGRCWPPTSEGPLMLCLYKCIYIYIYIYTHTHMLSCLSRSTQSCAALAKVGAEVWKALEAVYRLCLGSWSSRFSADETMPASSSHASPMNPSRFKWPESSETSGSVTHRNGSSDQATCAVEISSGPTLDGKRKCTHGEAYPLLRVSDQWAEVFLRHGEERRREALSTTLSGLHGHPRSRERTPSRTRRGVRLHNLPSGQTR